MPDHNHFERSATFESTPSLSTLHNAHSGSIPHNAPSHSYERVPAGEREEGRSHTTASETLLSGSNKFCAEESSRQNIENGMLTRSPFYWWFLIPVDVLLSLTPLFFLIVAGLCLSLNNCQKSKFGEDVKAITLLSPTIFPIVYAAILGKMLRRVALFKAERSATVGTVERLVGCQSLFSTFERQFAFRRIDVLGLGILLAWLMSPLGGQFSLRLLSTKPFLVPVNDTIRYFPVEGYGQQTHVFNLDISERAWPLFAPLYMTALLTSKQYLSLPMDQFGNVKIPDIFQLSTYTSESPTGTWFEVDKGSTADYTSVIGIPTAGLPESGNVSFNLISHYWSVDCKPLTFVENIANKTLNQTKSFNMIPEIVPDANNITHFEYLSRWITWEGTARFPNKTSPLVNVVSGRVYSAACQAFPLVVESQIACQGRSCAVQAMRRLHRDTEDVIGNYESSSAWFSTICASMPGADQGVLQKDGSSSELIEHWLMDPHLSTFKWDRIGSQGGVSKRWVNVANIEPKLFNRRLQIAVNTFWQSTIGSAIMMGNLTKQDVENLEDTSGFDPGWSTINVYTWNTTGLLGTRQEGEQYACNIWFAIITIAISLLLFGAAVASLVLGIFTKAPDTLGFVSTSARDNPYVTAQVPSHLDGLEAARTLRDVRIRIGDVNSTGDIGHVAFASMEADPQRVSRKRVYD